jgi:hypothetical protein
MQEPYIQGCIRSVTHGNGVPTFISQRERAFPHLFVFLWERWNYSDPTLLLLTSKKISIVLRAVKNGGLNDLAIYTPPPPLHGVSVSYLYFCMNGAIKAFPHTQCGILVGGS